MLRESDHEGIVRVELARTAFGRPLYRVSAFQIDDLLIDTGPPGTARELVAWVRGRPVRRVLNTHHHEDHIGGNAALQRELGLPIVAPEGSIPILRAWRRIPLYRRVVWGQPEDSVAEPLPEVVETRRHRLRAVPTPGHAFDHVALFDEERRWLFSGDLFVHERVRYLRRLEEPWTILDSLRKILALAPVLLVCSHSGFVPDPRGALERKISFWEGLAARARALADEGWSVRRIRRRLLGREGLMTWASFGDFSKTNLIRGLLARPEAGRPQVM